MIDNLYNQIQMKSNKITKLTNNHQLKLQINWQTISEIQTSLRKVLNSQPGLVINHQHLEILIKGSRQILRAIDLLKAQQKNHASMEQNYNHIQAKLNNHENIVKNLQKSHLERLKTITDQNKMARQYFQKSKKNLIQSEQQAKLQLAQIKKQNMELRFKVEVLQRQKSQLLKLQGQKQQKIQELSTQELYYKNILFTIQKKLPAIIQPPKDIKQSKSSVLQHIICSATGPSILQFLSPTEIANISLLSKKCTLFITKSRHCQYQIYKSILSHKNKIIKYYHKHVQYFEKIYMKIPEEILQLAFYRYEIVKHNIGGDILAVLNKSAMLFQGKFVEQGEDIIDDKEDTIKINQAEIQQQVLKQIEKVQDYNQNARKDVEDIEDIQSKYKKSKQQIHTILQIDTEIVRDFLCEQKSQKIKIHKDINLMYKKIQDTAQLYSADVESIGLFLKNVLKNFSKVFVLSKNLYSQSRNLQSLNTFILRQLSNWHKIQVKYTSQIQDLKAQLEAQVRLKLFFSDKSLKSQQKSLTQQNLRLTYQTKYNKQVQKLNQICKEKQELQSKVQQFSKNLKNLQGQNKEIRKAYEIGKEKYRKIIQQLGVVKETIVRMNIM